MATNTIERHTHFRGDSEGQQEASYREFVASRREAESSVVIDGGGIDDDGDGEYVVLNGIKVKLGGGADSDGEQDKEDSKDQPFLSDLKAAVGGRRSVANTKDDKDDKGSHAPTVSAPRTD